jgi:hypothetical protein
LDVVSDDFGVSVDRCESNDQLAVASSEAKTKSAKEFWADEIFITPSANVDPARIAAPQLSTLKDCVVVNELSIGFKDDRTLANRQDEAGLGKAVLTGIGYVLLSSQYLHPKLLRQSVVYRRLLLTDRYVRILREAHDYGAGVLHSRPYYRVRGPTGLP